MALKIKRATEIAQQKPPTITIFGGEVGSGKTTTALTRGDTEGSTLYIDTDRGVHRSQLAFDVFEPESWTELSSLSVQDVRDYQIIVIDTLGELLEMIVSDIIQHSGLVYAGAPNQQGWGAILGNFTSFFNKLRSFQKEIIMTCHTRWNEKLNKYYFDVRGSSALKALKKADNVGHIYMAQNGKRYLDFNAYPTFDFAKSVYPISPMEIPDFSKNRYFLADVMEEMNEKAQISKKENTEIDLEAKKYRNEIKCIQTAKDLNVVVNKLKEIKNEALLKRVKWLIANQAKALGLSMPQKGSLFEEKAK